MQFQSPDDFAVACRTMPGETVCGDRAIVVPFNGGVLLAVVDALGHGNEAADSAILAEEALQQSPEESVISQVRYCHAALRGKRGVVMSLAKYDERAAVLSWLSIGNVEGVFQRSPQSTGMLKSRLITRGGVVGSSLPDLRAEMIDASSGGLLLFATDGIDQAFGDLVTDDRPLQETADDILQRHGKQTDDALILAARIQTGRPQ